MINTRNFGDDRFNLGIFRGEALVSTVLRDERETDERLMGRAVAWKTAWEDARPDVERLAIRPIRFNSTRAVNR